MKKRVFLLLFVGLGGLLLSCEAKNERFKDKDADSSIFKEAKMINEKSKYPFVFMSAPKEEFSTSNDQSEQRLWIAPGSTDEAKGLYFSFGADEKFYLTEITLQAKSDNHILGIHVEDRVSESAQKLEDFGYVLVKDTASRIVYQKDQIYIFFFVRDQKIVKLTISAQDGINNDEIE